MKTFLPPHLNPGDTIGLIGVSNHIYDRQERFDKSIKIFEQEFGVKIKLGKYALGHYHYSSGTVQERLDDFHAMMKDPNINAIQFTVGGDTAIDLVDKLDYELISKYPKIISGFSDCSVLLNAITAKTGLITHHGFEFSFLGYEGKPDYMLQSIHNTWFDTQIINVQSNSNWRDWRNTYNHYTGWKGIKSGSATGPIVGGNIFSVLQLIDTEYCPQLHNSILVIEAYKQDKKSFHRLLSTLRLHHVFNQISGLIVGYCVGLDDQDDNDPSWDLTQILQETTTGYKFPVLHIGEIGHYVENVIIPIGATATINTSSLTFSIDNTFNYK